MEIMENFEFTIHFSKNNLNFYWNNAMRGFEIWGCLLVCKCNKLNTLVLLYPSFREISPTWATTIQIREKINLGWFVPLKIKRIKPSLENKKWLNKTWGTYFSM